LQTIDFPDTGLLHDYNHLQSPLAVDYLEHANFGSLFDKLSEDVDKENIPARRTQAAQAKGLIHTEKQVKALGDKGNKPQK